MQPEEFLEEFGVSRETLEKLKLYEELVGKWQRAMNLVGPNTFNDFWIRHFADSAQLAVLIPQEATVADLGSGAGLPGMVLRLMRPDLKMHLIESDERKAQFLRTVSRETTAHVIIHNERVEKVLADIRPAVITARAFAPLVKILDMVCETGTRAKLLLPKGKEYGDEIWDAHSKYDFSAENIPSRTDSQARILVINEFQKRG